MQNINMYVRKLHLEYIYSVSRTDRHRAVRKIRDAVVAGVRKTEPS